ncbi:hypothetical protein B0H13DRAFT_1715704 [Mycena leptocephala]|nr:hypothetical protein B0H13DRAFT_1715704 [Mycena leptocephala]
MDSQLTLVDSALPICLTFSKDSMINTTLYRDSRPVYTISTKLQGTATEIRAAGTAELLARICRNDILPNTVAFPSINDGKEMRLSKWLRGCKLPDGSHAYVIETELGKCFLKKHRTHRLVLFTEHDLETPVAHWELPDGSSPLSLILYPGTENFHPQIIAAFTIQDLKMRMAGQASTAALRRPGVVPTLISGPA